MHLYAAIRDSAGDDERGVTPVVGIILLVAITIILAATVAALVLGIGDETNTISTANFEWEYQEDASPPELEVTMQTGEKIRVDYLVFRGTKDPTAGSDIASGGLEWNAASSHAASGTKDATDAVTAGDYAVIEEVGSAYDLELVYVPDDEDNSAILDSKTGPTA